MGRYDKTAKAGAILLAVVAVFKLVEGSSPRRCFFEGGILDQVSHAVAIDIIPEFQGNRSWRPERPIRALLARGFQPRLVKVDARVCGGKSERLVLPVAIATHRPTLEFLAFAREDHVPIHFVSAGNPITHAQRDRLTEEHLAAAGDFGHDRVGRRSGVPDHNAGKQRAASAEGTDYRRWVGARRLAAVGEKDNTSHVLLRPIARQGGQARLKISCAIGQQFGRPAQVQRRQTCVHGKDLDASILLQRRNDGLLCQLHRPLVSRKLSQAG